MLIVISLFLVLGGLLHLYADSLGATRVLDATTGKTLYMLNGVNAGGDNLFPIIALNYLPPAIGIIFIIALISALFPSADGAITALTSSFCIDILGMKRREDWTEDEKKKIRQKTHLTFAAIFLVFVMIYKFIDSKSMIGIILKVAAYTYGPLLGLFTFGIITKLRVKDKLVPFVCIAAPIICFFLDKYQKQIFGDFEVGLELLIINGLITFIGLLFLSTKKEIT